MPYLDINDYIYVCFAWKNIPPSNSAFNENPLIFANGLLYDNESTIRPKLYVYINNKINSEKLIKKFNNILIINRINTPDDLIKCFRNYNIIKEDILNIEEDNEINLLDIEEIEEIEEIDLNEIEENPIPKSKLENIPPLLKIVETKENKNIPLLKTVETKDKNKFEKLTLQNVIINDYSQYIAVSKSVAKIDKNNRNFSLIYDTKTNKVYYPNEVVYKQKGHHMKAQYRSIHISNLISTENIQQLKNKFNELSDKMINLSNCKNIDEQLLRYLITIIRDYKLFISNNNDNNNDENKGIIQIIDNNKDNIDDSKKIMKINKVIKDRIKQFIIMQTNTPYPIVKPTNFEFEMIFSYQGRLININTLNENTIINKNKTAVKGGLITVFNSTFIDMNKFKELFEQLNIRTIEDAYYNIYKYKLIEQCLKKDYPFYDETIKEFEANYILNEQIIKTEFNLFDEESIGTIQHNDELINALLNTLFTKIHHVEIDIGISLLRINNKKGLIEHLNSHELRSLIDGGIKSIKIVNKHSETFIFKNPYIMKLLMYKIIEYYQSQNLLN